MGRLTPAVQQNMVPWLLPWGGQNGRSSAGRKAGDGAGAAVTPVKGSAYGMPDLGSAERTGCGGCSLSLFARYRADPTADCAGVLITRTDRDERDKKDTEPANALRQVVRTLIPAAFADHRDRA